MHQLCCRGDFNCASFRDDDLTHDVQAQADIARCPLFSRFMRCAALQRLKERPRPLEEKSIRSLINRCIVSVLLLIIDIELTVMGSSFFKATLCAAMRIVLSGLRKSWLGIARSICRDSSMRWE